MQCSHVAMSRFMFLTLPWNLRTKEVPMWEFGHFEKVEKMWSFWPNICCWTINCWLMNVHRKLFVLSSCCFCCWSYIQTSLNRNCRSKQNKLVEKIPINLSLLQRSIVSKSSSNKFSYYVQYSFPFKPTPWAYTYIYPFIKHSTNAFTSKPIRISSSYIYLHFRNCISNDRIE